MLLHSPFEITSRLMAGIKIGDGTISIGYLGVSHDNRTVYDVWIDVDPLGNGGGQEFRITDLQSGCGGGSLQQGMKSLLSFLGAAAESYQHQIRTGHDGENEDVFPRAVVKWAAQNSDEIAMLGCELEDTPGLIEETNDEA